ncbi:helix-turn-helix transcriptional regulator [Micromonospora rubida]|uniref:Helix-turn-helix transcriptional regulator n=1 Tax=Micromonospora rubida TaxID=2697657 RepID=A0ABW7SJG3_9ACTN
MTRRQAVPREPSPLRRARIGKGWTLENVVEAFDQRTTGGHSGVTPTMVSGWELGRHTTSHGHRRTLCAIYGRSADELFAHQDTHLGDQGDGPRLLARYADLHETVLTIVADARECLVVTGSRSRDCGYLQAIEVAIAARPALVFYRILHGPPHYRVLRDHLVRLLGLRDPRDRSLGVKTLNLGIEDDRLAPERFFTASERAAVVPIPSLTSHEAFDSGVLLGAGPASRLLDHGRQAYAAARRIETLDDVEALDVLRERSDPGSGVAGGAGRLRLRDPADPRPRPHPQPRWHRPVPTRAQRPRVRCSSGESSW